MPKNAIKAEVNTFAAGVITEASPLNYPPNATLEEENYELDHKAIRRRRLGMDKESGGSVFEWGYTPNAVYEFSFRWAAAGGFPGLNLAVSLINNTLYFFRDIEGESYTANAPVGSVVPSQNNVTNGLSFTAIDGVLVVVDGTTGYIGIVKCTGSAESPIFAYSTQRVRVRDFWGVQVPSSQFETDVFFRSGTVPNLQYYNFYNQGWGVPRNDTAGNYKDPILSCISIIGTSPANSDIVWSGMETKPDGAGIPREYFSPESLRDSFGETGYTPKGSFIIDAVDRGASRATVLSETGGRYSQLNTNSITLVFPSDYTLAGPSTVATFAGRVFYSGVNGPTQGGDTRSPNLSNYVFFSQVVKGTNKFGDCYQEGDPTSRSNFDIVDTDGGYITIRGADRIRKIIAMKSSLIVLASNGVWAITGGSDYGFGATNYKVDKVSDFGIIGRNTAVYQNGSVMYWSSNGINVVAKNSTGDFEVFNISDSTIKTAFLSISEDSKSKAYGAFDEYLNKVKWIYPHSTLESVEIEFNTQLKAFSFKRYFSNTEKEMIPIGIINTSLFAVQRPSGFSEFQNTKYTFLFKDADSSCEEISAYCYKMDFRDFEDYGNVDAKAFMLTGAQIVGDSSVKKQIQYLTMHFERSSTGVDSLGEVINPSECNMRMQWDWSGAASSNKWSSTRQIYRDLRAPAIVPSSSYESGFDIVTTKNLVRGQGRSFSMYLETSPEKDCQILGWSVSADGNSKV